MNQSELNTNAKATPAAMLTLAITSGTATETPSPCGNDGDKPAQGLAGFRRLQNHQLWLRLRVAVVLRGLTLEREGDVALLFAIGSRGLDRVHLISVAEGNLDPEGAVCGEGNILTTDGETGRRVSSAVNDQFSIGNQPEGALTRRDAPKAGLVTAAGPEADP